MSTDPILKITRESLSSGVVAKMVAQRDDETKVASDDELLASRRGVVPEDQDDQARRDVRVGCAAAVRGDGG